MTNDFLNLALILFAEGYEKEARKILLENQYLHFSSETDFAQFMQMQLKKERAKGDDSIFKKDLLSREHLVTTIRFYAQNLVWAIDPGAGLPVNINIDNGTIKAFVNQMKYYSVYIDVLDILKIK